MLDVHRKNSPGRFAKSKEIGEGHSIYSFPLTQLILRCIFYPPCTPLQSVSGDHDLWEGLQVVHGRWS